MSGSLLFFLCAHSQDNIIYSHGFNHPQTCPLSHLEVQESFAIPFSFAFPKSSECQSLARFYFLLRFCFNCLFFSIPTTLFLSQGLKAHFEFSNQCCGPTGLSVSMFGPIISILHVATKSNCETPQLKSFNIWSLQDKTKPSQHHIILKLLEYLAILHWLESTKTGTLSNHFRGLAHL